MGSFPWLVMVLVWSWSPNVSEANTSLLEALETGREKAQLLIDQERPTVIVADQSFPAVGSSFGFLPPPPPTQAQRLVFSFRRADPASRKEAQCSGRVLLEASKTLVTENNIKPEDASDYLSQQTEDLTNEQCQQQLESIAECELVEPPTPSCDPAYPYRSIDGACNNLANPKWGSARIAFRRLLNPDYEDGVDSLRGSNRPEDRKLPSPRTVSIRLQEAEQRPQRGRITLMVMQWGQFTDHDLVHTAEAAIGDEGESKPKPCCEYGHIGFLTRDDSEDCQPIDVSEDPLHAALGRSCMRFVRSLIANQGCRLGPREQVNQVTAFLDGSAVYGSTATLASDLRSHRGGQLNQTKQREGGRGHLLPFVECMGAEEQASGGHCFKAGDGRVNEQPALASMHTLWVRAHNTFATLLSMINPHWEDNKLYEETRRIVVALIQQITYRDFLPIILGHRKMYEFDLYPLSTGYSDAYDPSEDASALNVFATAAFRFGHTLVDDTLRGSRTSLPLVGNFFNADVLFKDDSSPSALLEGLASTHAQPSDAYLVRSLTDNLFKGEHDDVGMDLMALNIQRGRDHGLPAYLKWRKFCNLSDVSFYDLTSVMFPPVAQVFHSLYRSVDDIDLFPAALAEDLDDDAVIGPTFACIVGRQFARLKRGDRFWYENRNQPNPFTEDQLAAIREVGLASILCQNTLVEYIQPNPFLTVINTGNEPRLCTQYTMLDLEPWREGGTVIITTTQPPIPGGVCHGVGIWKTVPGIDQWCSDNCFHYIPFCPLTHCECEKERIYRE